ncbi:hypothetical protein Aperf_G00000115877 [Anoplocephala perfoliata]
MLSVIYLPAESVADETHDRHFWYDTSESGDYCYVGELECTKAGPRKKCASCRIVCHTTCIPRLDAKCKPTFRQVTSSTYRERNSGQAIVKHHWVLQRQQENRCHACKKWIQTKFKFRDTLYMQCSWCRLCYHNKPECFKSALLSVNCPLGKHAKLIIPPTWIVKIPNQEVESAPFRRSPSNPVFSLAPPMLKPSASFEILQMRSRNSTSSDDLVVTSSASATGLSLPPPSPTIFASPKPASSVTYDFPFVVKPSYRTAVCPLVVFINPKAGGNQGVRLLKKFQGILNPRQVFSLSEGGPELGLELFGRLPNVRILVCGGDGTVGWILSVIDSMALYPTPPVAILPLGTGNDLARTLRWGPGYADEPLSKILTSVEEGRMVLLDRWDVTSRQLTPADPEFDDETEISLSVDAAVGSGQLAEKLPLNVMNNYFSLGADAATALEFHESREANPDRFNSRLKNKIFYAGVGGMDLIKRSWRDLSDYVTLVCDGVNMVGKLRELRPHALLFLNIPKYSAGTVPWGHSSGADQQQRIDDKKIEVIGLTIASLATLQMGGHGDRICQCSEVSLTTRKTIPMQIDGEPFRLGPSIIEIRLKNQAFVVQKTRRVDGSSPAHFGITNTSGRLVKIYIIYPDPNERLQSFDLLMKSAQHFASLRIGAYSDLTSVRRQIKHSHGSPNSKGESVKLPNKWIFLDMTAINGQVYGIDPSLESAHFITDILSYDNKLFLISQDGNLQENLLNTLQSPNSEDISRKSSESSQPIWENAATMERKEFYGYHPKRLVFCKSPSAIFIRGDVYKNISFTSRLGTSFSCPNLSSQSFESLGDAIIRNHPSHHENTADEMDDVEYNTSSTTSTLQQRRCFPDWRRWRCIPPKIFVSMATCKRVKESSVGVAPDPVQSLNNLLSAAEPSSPVKKIPTSKISVTSDPGFSPGMHDLIRSNLRSYFFSACRMGHLQEVQTALDAGISPLVSDPTTGKTGLHHAAKFGRINILQYLIRNAPRELLDMQDREKMQTALHKAAIAKRRRACEELVRAGACATCEDISGDTPSALALEAGDKKLAHFLQREELMQLIKHSNEEAASNSSANVTSLSNLMTSHPPPPP